MNEHKFTREANALWPSAHYFLEKGRKVMGFRVRDKQLNIRVTDYEYAHIKQHQEESGCKSLQEYIIKASINGYLIKVDYSDMKQLAYEINKIGTNINQIAHKINSEGLVYKSEIEAIQEDIDRIWKAVRGKFYQIP